MPWSCSRTLHVMWVLAMAPLREVMHLGSWVSSRRRVRTSRSFVLQASVHGGGGLERDGRSRRGRRRLATLRGGFGVIGRRHGSRDRCRRGRQRIQVGHGVLANRLCSFRCRAVATCEKPWTGSCRWADVVTKARGPAEQLMGAAACGRGMLFVAVK